MNRADTLALTDADLAHTLGGYPANSNPKLKEGPAGGPPHPVTPEDIGQLLNSGKQHHKPVPGEQTPPIYVFPTA
jgi:hypothetical protein